jgi:hypothetical protein
VDPAIAAQVELGLALGWRQSILDRLNPDAQAADVTGGVKQRPARGDPQSEGSGVAQGAKVGAVRGVRALVGEEGDRGWRGAQPLVEPAEPCRGIPGLAVGIADQSGERTDHQGVEPGAFDEEGGDVERLADVLRNDQEEIGEIDAAASHLLEVGLVGGVDEGDEPVLALGVGDEVEGENALAGAGRPDDLGDLPAGEAADASRQIEGEGAGADRAAVAARAADGGAGIAEPIDDPGAEAAFKLVKRDLESIVSVSAHGAVPL